MWRFRFHVGTLVILVLILGIGLAALRESNAIWDSGVFTLAMGILFSSIPLAVHRTEKRRAFWLGFALFGCIYLGLSQVLSIQSRLITTKALAYLDSKVPGRPMRLYTVVLNTGTGSGMGNNQVSNVTFAMDGIQAASAKQGQVMLWDTATGKLRSGWNGTTENFVGIGHSLFALLAAWIGGQLSRRICRSSRSEEPITAVAVEGIAR